MSDRNKIYVLDTNVLLHDPNSMFSFEGANVGIPAVVLEELDKFKTESSDRGRNSREVIRKLDKLRMTGSLTDGVNLGNGGTLRVLFVPDTDAKKISPFFLNNEDNKILLLAREMQSKGDKVTFISKDINARVKADTLGIPTEDYLTGRVSEYDIYKGWEKIEVDSSQLKKTDPEELHTLSKQGNLIINEFVLMESKNNPYNYSVFRYLGGDNFKYVSTPKMGWNLSPKNAQQLMALDLLFDPNIQLVSLIGPAGTGKTFLALLAGLDQVLKQDIYEKILVSRPIIPLGPDIGYLPGDIQEKLFSWMQPVYDNMNLIAHSSGGNQHLNELKDESRGRHKGKRYKGSDHKREINKGRLGPLDAMINSGKISLEAITYMRGRSIPYQFIIIDEVQNLTPHEVKTLITRVGEGSKIILCGDPYQIDSPYLDFSSNGLIVSSNSFKNHSIFGTVFLEISERSELSRMACELL